MIFELKRYEASPGNAGALIDRFQRVTMPLFARHGIELLHCWTAPGEPDAFHYLVRFADADASAKAWKAFAADPDWIAAKAASETRGPLLASQSTTTLLPTSFSPSRS